MAQTIRYLVEKAGAVERFEHSRLQLWAAGMPLALLAKRICHVVEDAHREGIRLLEHHRHAPPEVGHLEPVDLLAVEGDSAVARSGRGELGQPVQGTEQGRL